MRPFVLCLSVLAASGAAHAAEWTADPAASKLEFSGTQLGQPFRGHFGHFTARIMFDPAQPQAGHADVVIDMTSAATGDTQRDTALPEPEWFDTKKFAQATFHAASFTAKGGDAYEAIGKLTVRGVGVDLTTPFTLTIDGETAHARGHADLLRSAIGVGQGPWVNDQYVALQVGVDFDVVARRAP